MLFMLKEVNQNSESPPGNNCQVDNHDEKKVALLGISFFLIIGAYSILRPLKTSIFLGFVGKEYQPIQKILSMIIMIPLMLGYSKLIDKLKKHQSVYFFLLLYAALGVTFAYLFLHPVYGVKNTQTSSSRLLGWSFEFVMDS